MSLVLLNVKLCGKGNILEKVVLFAGGWHEKKLLLVSENINWVPIKLFSASR